MRDRGHYSSMASTPNVAHELILRRRTGLFRSEYSFRMSVQNIHSERPFRTSFFSCFPFRKSRCTLLFFFFSFSPFLLLCPFGIVVTLTALRSADTHQSLSIETTFRIMNTFHSNAPKPLSPGYLTPRHVPREEENTSTIPIRSPTKGRGMSTQRALELIKLMPKPKYTGWRSDRQKAEAARAKAKAAEAKAEAEAKKAEAEAAPMRLMNQKKEEDDKESQQN